jgi:GNAT superfamily N-acetyltransferase
VTLSLTPAGPDDYDFTHDLTRANMEHYVARFWGAWDSEIYRGNYDRTENLILCLNGIRVGFIRLFTEADRLILEDLQILPGFQNRGIGSWALVEVDRFAGDRGFRAIRLRCFHINPAYQLYLRSGFAVVEPGDVADWLEKSLSSLPD